MAGGGPDMDCVFMKFLMLCILVCVNFPSMSLLDFFFKLLSLASCLAGDRLRTEGGSRLITLSEDGVATSSGFASDARKPLPFSDIDNLASETDSVCRNLDMAGLGGFTIIVSMFLTENRGGPLPDTPLPVTDITDGLLIGVRMATGLATSIGE